MQIAAVMAISADLPVTPVLTCRNHPLSRGQEVFSIMGLTDSSIQSKVLGRKHFQLLPGFLQAEFL